MNTRTLAANTATIMHAAIDLALILVLGSIAALLDKYDQLKERTVSNGTGQSQHQDRDLDR